MQADLKEFGSLTSTEQSAILTELYTLLQRYDLGKAQPKILD